MRSAVITGAGKYGFLSLVVTGVSEALAVSISGVQAIQE